MIVIIWVVQARFDFKKCDWNNQFLVLVMPSVIILQNNSTINVTYFLLISCSDKMITPPLWYVSSLILTLWMYIHQASHTIKCTYHTVNWSASACLLYPSHLFLVIEHHLLTRNDWQGVMIHDRDHIGNTCELHKEPPSLYFPKVRTACLTEMLHRFKLRILLECLTLLLFGVACEASSLGLAVYTVPLDSNGGKTVGKKKDIFVVFMCKLFGTGH